MQSRLIPSMKRLKDMGAGSEDIESSQLLDVEPELEENETL